MTPEGLHELLAGEPLSVREVQALHGAALGESARQTGERLFLAADTVRHHRKTAQAKLGARNTTRAVVVAIALGMLNLDRLVPLDTP
jgi:DNA-binding CsgD family transcriptional regulator